MVLNMVLMMLPTISPPLPKLLDHMLTGLLMKPGKELPGVPPMLSALMLSRNTVKKLSRWP